MAKSVTPGSYRRAAFHRRSDQRHLEQRVAARRCHFVWSRYVAGLWYNSPDQRSQTLIERRRQQGQQQPQPIQIVCSPFQGTWTSKARFFGQPVPRWLLTTTASRVLKAWHGSEKAFERIWIAPYCGPQ